MTNIPTIRRAIVLPDAAVIGDAKLAAKVTEVADLREKAEKSRQDAVEASFAVERAEADDRQREADHARGRVKTKPKPTAPKAQAKADELARKADVARIAAADAESELLDVLAERGPALAEAEREKAAAVVAQAHECFAKASEHLESRSGHASLALWFEDCYRWRYAKDLAPSTPIQKMNGDAVSLGEALSVVLEATDPGARQPKTRDQRTWRDEQPKAQPLRPAPRAA